MLGTREHLRWNVSPVGTSQMPGAARQTEEIFTVSSAWQRGMTSLAWLETLVSLTVYQQIKETASVVAEIGLLVDWLQELGVHLSQRKEVREYLLQFANLIDVVPLSVRAALDHLPEAHLFLEVYNDPEIEDRYLMLYVRVQQYDESIIERIEAAEKEYIDLLSNKEGWLQMSTDFQELELV